MTTPYIRRQFKGNVSYQDYLASGINNTALSISLHDGSTFPDGSVGPFVITIDPDTSTEEKVLCQSRTGAVITVVTGGRGWDNTTAQVHTAGGPGQVIHSISAVDLDETNQLVHALLTGGTTGQVATVDTTLTPPIKLAAAPVTSFNTRTGAITLTSADVATALGGAGAWTSYTPTVGGTGWAVGNGSVNGYYRQIDAKTLALRLHFAFGTTTTVGTGALTLSLPGGMSAANPNGTQQSLYGIMQTTGGPFSCVAFLANGATAATPQSPAVNTTSQFSSLTSSTTNLTASASCYVAIQGVIEVQ